MIDLTKASEANIQFMIGEIKDKLKVATAASIKAEHFGVGRYEDIKEIYEVVMSVRNFSISEIEALCDELKRLKDNG
jgi:uncharacterized protein YfkK (UPF0435 family)